MTLLTVYWSQVTDRHCTESQASFNHKCCAHPVLHCEYFLKIKIKKAQILPLFNGRKYTNKWNSLISATGYPLRFQNSAKHCAGSHGIQSDYPRVLHVVFMCPIIVTATTRLMPPSNPRTNGGTSLNATVSIGPSLCSVTSMCVADQDQNSLLVKRQTDNHSPGPVTGEISP